MSRDYDDKEKREERREKVLLRTGFALSQVEKQPEEREERTEKI